MQTHKTTILDTCMHVQVYKCSLTHAFLIEHVLNSKYMCICEIKYLVLCMYVLIKTHTTHVCMHRTIYVYAHAKIYSIVHTIHWCCVCFDQYIHV